MLRWNVVWLAIALGCRGSGDPLYGARPVPRLAPPAAAPPAPRPQVMVAVQESGVAPEAPAAAAPADDPVDDPVDEERARNETAFEREYLRSKERLFAEHAGEWIAIAVGRLLPVDERGRLAPAPSFDECVRAVDAQAVEALHRFVFRIGEEGDVLYSDSSATPRSIVGGTLRSSLGVSPTFDAGRSEVRWTREGRTHAFPLAADRFVLLLADAAGVHALDARVAESATFGGFLVLEAPFADLLRAPLFEIPGRAFLDTPSGMHELRRTRLRVRVPELEVDALVPIAAW